MSKKNEVVAPESAPVIVAPQVNATSDALKGRFDCRTHAMHAVLIEAAREGRTMKTNEIVFETRKLLGASHRSYEKLDRTAPSHLNTMRRRDFIERVEGAWRLTALGASLCNVEAPSTDAPAKKTRKSKTEKKAPAKKLTRREKNEALAALRASK